MGGRFKREKNVQLRVKGVKERGGMNSLKQKTGGWGEPIKI